jgi:protease I
MARIAMIADDMFEDSELREPYDRLREAGHEVVLVGLEAGKQITGKKGHEKVTIERAADDVRADEFDALVIPGGYSPDKLRTSLPMVAFTRAFFDQGKLVAAVCHAPWMLIEADVTEDRTLTSWPSIRTDLLNSGARWVDREVVEDGNLVTSRKPDDLPAFCATILRRLGERAADRPGRPSGAASPDAAAR